MKHSESQKNAHKKYDMKRAKQIRLPGTRLNDDEAAILKEAIKLHGGTGKETIVNALELFIKNKT